MSIGTSEAQQQVQPLETEHELRADDQLLEEQIRQRLMKFGVRGALIPMGMLFKIGCGRRTRFGVR